MHAQYVVVTIIIIALLIVIIAIWWNYSSSQNNLSPAANHNLAVMEHIWTDFVYLHRLYITEALSGSGGYRTTLSSLNGVANSVGDGYGKFFGSKHGEVCKSLMDKKLKLHLQYFSQCKEGRSGDNAKVVREMKECNSELGNLYLASGCNNKDLIIKIVSLMEMLDKALMEEVEAMVRRDHRLSHIKLSESLGVSFNIAALLCAMAVNRGSNNQREDDRSSEKSS